MKCSRCGNGDLSRSHRRGPEKIITAVMPVRPFRCTRCSTRGWKRLPWVKNQHKYLPLGVIVFTLAVLVSRSFGAADDPRAFTPLIAEENPVQLVPIPGYLLRGNEPVQRAAKATSVNLSSAPEVHLWIGFRAYPAVSKNMQRYLLHSNQMRFSVPTQIQ